MPVSGLRNRAVRLGDCEAREAFESSAPLFFLWGGWLVGSHRAPVLGVGFAPIFGENSSHFPWGETRGGAYRRCVLESGAAFRG